MDTVMKKELKGSSIIKLDMLEGFPLVKETMTLEELIKRKQVYTTKANSIGANIVGMHSPTLEQIDTAHKKIVALQYNNLLIKLRIATLNVGVPEKGYNGIFASIYQSSDLVALNTTLLNVRNKQTNREGEDIDDIRKYIDKHMKVYKKLIAAHRRTQTAYNKAIKIEVELYNVD